MNIRAALRAENRVLDVARALAPPRLQPLPSSGKYAWSSASTHRLRCRADCGKRDSLGRRSAGGGLAFRELF